MRRILLFILVLFFALGCQAAEPDLGPLEKEVEAIRGLKFTAPVKVQEVSQARMRAAVQAQLDADTSSPNWASEVAALKAFGLIPRKMDLKRSMAALLDSQVAGLYDPRAKLLYVSGDAGSEIDDELGIAGLALPEGFSTRNLFLVHELTHALDDQHFNLLSLPMDDASNSDRATAARCVVEGDATYVMVRYAATALKMTDEQVGMMSDLSMAIGIGKELLPSYPDYVQEELLIPYIAGYELVKQVAAKRGEKGVDDLFRRPPASMRDVLHPEKFLAGAPVPASVKADPPPASPLKSAKKIFGGVWGEFDARLVLKSWGVPAGEAEQAAGGWAGDAFSVFDEANGATAFLWVTRWEKESDAARFVSAIAGVKGIAVQREGRLVTIMCLSAPPRPMIRPSGSTATH